MSSARQIASRLIGQAPSRSGLTAVVSEQDG
jgi:hypothetical protein